MSSPVLVSADDALAGYFTTHDVNRRIFRADLHIARYVLELGEQDAPSAIEFATRHDDVAADITGRRIDLRALCNDDERLSDILRLWARLYRAALRELQARYPARLGTHLEFEKVDWTMRLGIATPGLAAIDQASRYAEYWAQQAIRSDEIYNSFDSRYDFISSRTYRDLAELRERGDLRIFGSDRLGTPSYDLADLARERPAVTPVRDWLMLTGNYPTILRRAAEQYLTSLSSHAVAATTEYLVKIVTAVEVLPFIECNIDSHPLAAYFARSDPQGLAWIALDGGGALGGCVVSGSLPNAGPPPMRCLIVRDQACSWTLLDAIRASAPFQRLYFDRPTARRVGSVFPNQPIRDLWALTFEGTPSGSCDGGEIRLVDRPDVPLSLRTSIIAEVNQIDVQLVTGGKVQAECQLNITGRDSAIVTMIAPGDNMVFIGELLAGVGNAARSEGIFLQVLVEARDEEVIATCEASGFDRSNRCNALDEWYFEPNAPQLLRSQIPLGVRRGAPAGSLSLR